MGEPARSVEVPPMLRASWEALVSASANHPELIPADSPAGWIADRLFGVGVWLTWRTRPTSELRQAARARQRAPRVDTARGPHLALAVQELSQALISDRVSAQPSALDAPAMSGLAPAAQSVVTLASSLAVAPMRWTTGAPLTDSGAVEALGVPRSVVAMALDDALEILGEDLSTD